MYFTIPFFIFSKILLLYQASHGHWSGISYDSNTRELSFCIRGMQIGRPPKAQRRARPRF